jgi:hypothetical protein
MIWIYNIMKERLNKMHYKNHWNGNMEILGRKFLPHSLNASRFWLLLRRITMWTIWVERNDLTFNGNRWDVKETNQMIWQGLLVYNRIA